MPAIIIKRKKREQKTQHHKKPGYQSNDALYRNDPTKRTTFTVDANAFAPSVMLNNSYPILEKGNQSFSDGKYVMDFIETNDNRPLTIKHSINNAKLIKDMLDNGEAMYVCVISSPKSSYRQLAKTYESEQKLEWDPSDLGEPPLFSPMVVSAVSKKIKLNYKKHGVAKEWHGERVTIKKGARLVIGPVIRLDSSLDNIMSFEQDQSLGDGQFKVIADTNNDFNFIVRLARDLHRFMRPTKIRGAHQQHVMTNIMTACLSLLQRKYSEDEQDEGWRSYRNLRSLETSLKEQGIKCLWYEDEFQPEYAATILKPYKLPDPSEEDEQSEI